MKEKKKKILIISLIVLIPLLIGATIGILFAFLYNTGYEVSIEINGDYGKVTNNLNVSKIPSGSNIAYVIDPNVGYEIKSIEIDGEIVEVTADSGDEQIYVFRNVSSNHTISVEFVIRKFTATFKNPDGTTLETQTVNYGSNAVLPAGPEKTGYTFTGWLGIYQNVKTDVILTPAYDINTFGISVNAGANGQILPVSITVEYGNNATFTIDPDLGYNISSIKIDNEEIDITAGVGESQSYTFTNVTKSHTITAEFAIQVFEIVVTQPANGVVAPSGISTSNYGSNKNISIIPDDGYFVSAIIVNGVSISISNDGSSYSYALENITQNYTITATIEYKWGYDELTQKVSYLGSGSPIEVTIPSSIETGSGNVNVTKIDFNTISNSVQVLNLPGTLTIFESGSTSHLTNLTKFTIGNGSPFQITNDCLYKDSNKTLIAVPSAKTLITFYPLITKIDSYALENSNIEEFSFPNTVTSVGDYCFKGSSVSKLVLTNGIMDFSSSAFSDMFNLDEIQVFDEFNEDFSLPENFDETYTYGWKIYKDEPENAVDVFYLKNVGTYVKSDVITGYSAPVNYTEGWEYVEIDGKYYLTAVPENTTGELKELIIPSSLIIEGGEIVDIYAIGNDSDSLMKSDIFGRVINGNLDNYNSIIISYGIKMISRMAFSYRDSYNGRGLRFTSVRIPNSVEIIEENAFDNAQNLTSIVIPNNVKYIGNGAFYGCISLNDITILADILDLSRYCFDNTAWYNAQEAGLVYLGDDILYGIKGENNLSGNIIINEGIKIIAGDAFTHSYHITSISLPDSLISIGNRAFSQCGSLQEIIIPENVKFIGLGIVSLCPEITSITIPKSVVSIGGYYSYYNNKYYALSESNNLTQIIVSSENNYFKDDNGIALLSKDGKILYDYARGNTATSYTILSTVEEISASVFFYSISITNIEFEENSKLITIGKNAFALCQSLTTIDIPSSVRNIGSAFSFCTSLNAIVLPEGITNISRDLFSGCSSLTSIIIPTTVTEIGQDSFRACTGLTDMVIPANVTSIGQLAFSNCSNLATVTFEGNKRVFAGYETVKSIFKNCTSLERIYVNYNLLNDYDAMWDDTVSVKLVGYAQLEVEQTLDSETGYTITWYKTEADLIAKTNGIVADDEKTATESGTWYATRELIQ